MSTIYQIEQELGIIESILYDKGIDISFNKELIAQNTYEQLKEELNLHNEEKEDALSENLSESDPSFIVQGFFNGFDGISYNTIDDEEVRKAIRLADLTDEAMINSVVGTLKQLNWDEAEKEFSLF